MRRVLHLLLTSAAILSVPMDGPVAAQTVTGTVQGTVADTSGGVLPGVTVTLRNMETGVERTVVTNETGFYSAPFMPLGSYALTATLSGFGPVTRQGVQIMLNQTRVVDFTLDPQVTQEVTVTGDARQSI